MGDRHGVTFQPTPVAPRNIGSEARNRTSAPVDPVRILVALITGQVHSATEFSPTSGRPANRNPCKADLFVAAEELGLPPGTQLGWDNVGEWLQEAVAAVQSKLPRVSVDDTLFQQGVVQLKLNVCAAAATSATLGSV